MNAYRLLPSIDALLTRPRVDALSARHGRERVRAELESALGVLRSEIQSGLDAEARSRNLCGAFTVRKPCDSLRIALVDDVLTTGATAESAARELLHAGAASVDLWCLARTPAPEP